MAIDDNTSYELTGAQVKDLANKIKAKAADNIFVGATSALPGSKGLVPAPQAADDTKFLSGDGTWKTVSAGQAYTAGNGIDITSNTISIDTTVVAEVSDLPTNFTGATSQQAGSAGLVPAPTTSDPDKFLKGDGTWGTPAGKTYTAGDHINISNQDVISAYGYVWADAPTAATTPAGSITNGMIANSTLTASKFASGELLTLTMSTTDIGEGAPLAANTLYGVYE